MCDLIQVKLKINPFSLAALKKNLYKEMWSRRPPQKQINTGQVTFLLVSLHNIKKIHCGITTFGSFCVFKFGIFTRSYLGYGLTLVFSNQAKVSSENMMWKPENPRMCAKNQYCKVGLRPISPYVSFCVFTFSGFSTVLN